MEKNLKCMLCKRIWVLKDKENIEKFEVRGKCPVCHYREISKKIKKEKNSEC